MSAAATQISAKRSGSSITIGDVARVIVICLFIIFFAVPLIWLLLAPTKTHDQLQSLPPMAFGTFSHIPFVWQRLSTFNNTEILVWLRNSAVYSISGDLLALVTAIPAGYVMATANFPGRKLLLNLTLISMIVPGAALVLPLFLEFHDLHLLNTVWAVILPFGLHPFGAFLAYIYYSTSLDKAIMDAARVDGCGETRMFWNIALPLSGNIIGLVAFFNFVGNWNNYFLPFVVLTNDQQYPLTVGLEDLLSSSAAINPGSQSNFLPIYAPEVLLAGIVTVIPIMIVLLASQRLFARGILAGAVK